MKRLDWHGRVAKVLFLLVSVLTPALGSQILKRPALKIEEVIPEGYDSFQTPDVDGEPADVSLKLVILNIRTINVPSMSFIADVFLHEIWKDPRLRYPVKGNLERISLNPEWEKHIWTPDVYFQNALEGKVLDTIIPYTYLWLKNDSTVDFGARLSMEFSCDMLLHNFPHDTQTCDIVMKSLTHTSAEMNLHWNVESAISLGDAIFLPQFDLADPIRSSCNESSALLKHRGTFACIRGVIQFTRRSGYYFINVYVPCILIVLMSMLTFWIPVDAVPGRVTLGVTSLLTIITTQHQTALPNVSYVVAMNYWLSTCIGFVFCGLLEYSMVVALLSHQKRLLAKSMKSSSKDEYSEEKDAMRRPHKLADIIDKRLEKIDVYNIDRVCRFIFPLLFLIFCAAYFSIFLIK